MVRAGRRLRCVAVTLGATAAAALAVALLTSDDLGAPRGAAATAVARLCTGALLAAVVWGWCAVLAGVIEAWREPAPAAATGVRRWVLAACGVALSGTLGAAPAAHADPPPPPRPTS